MPYSLEQQTLFQDSANFISTLNCTSPETHQEHWQTALGKYKELVQRFEQFFNFKVTTRKFMWVDEFLAMNKPMLVELVHSRLCQIGVDLKPLVEPEKYPNMNFLYHNFQDIFAKSVFCELTSAMRNHINRFDVLYQNTIANSPPPPLFPQQFQSSLSDMPSPRATLSR